MGTAIVCIVIALVCIYGVFALRKKTTSGCCGSGGENVKRIKPADRHIENYPYAYRLVPSASRTPLTRARAFSPKPTSHPAAQPCTPNASCRKRSCAASWERRAIASSRRKLSQPASRTDDRPAPLRSPPAGTALL